MTPDPSLRDLYISHEGKGSDKWSSYLDAYESFLARKKDTILRMLEIGIQNGGSLEIWSRYFPKVEEILGVDIDPKVGELQYEDDRIRVLVADAAQAQTAEAIQELYPQGFDLIIDDGSHRSSDIIRSFSLLFKQLNPGGLYVVEDLHCSYWQEWEGGLYAPHSSIAFFKHLVDMVNHEHWGVFKTRTELISSFSQRLSIKFDEEQLATIQWITFTNSICVVAKSEVSKNQMEPRIIVGEDQFVRNNKNINEQNYAPPEQVQNPWSQQKSAPESIYAGLIAEQEKTSNLERELSILQKACAESHENFIEVSDQLVAIQMHAQMQSANLDAIRNSLSWRVTAPMRLISSPLFTVVHLFRKIGDLLKRYSLRDAFKISWLVLKEEGIGGWIKSVLDSEYKTYALEKKIIKKLPQVFCKLKTNRVHIIAELSIPQCKKYRVEQKAEILKKIGMNPSYSSWTDLEASLAGIDTANVVIFYRVPYGENFERQIQRCEAAGIPTVWEVDDAIFDKEILSQNSSLGKLSKEIVTQVMLGADLYKQAMLRCRYGLASTAPLASAMEENGMQSTAIVQNALDASTRGICERILDAERNDDEYIRIVYGSGTNTHDTDFLEAASAIVYVLKRAKNVKFRLIGPLELPDLFSQVMDKVEIFEQCEFGEYLEKLAQCDISIAPLENCVFNRAKSNIKYIEASMLGIPSACSEMPNFSSIIQNGYNGFLCSSEESWIHAFETLIRRPELRKFMGNAARRTVLGAYDLDAVVADLRRSNNEILDLLKPSNLKKRKRILVANCFYAPRAFGGATIVAEAMNKIISSADEFEIIVLTTLSSDYGNPYEVRRYQTGNHICFGIILPALISDHEEVRNPRLDEIFNELLSDLSPDLIHLHAIQGIGLGLPEAAIRFNIPYIITAHDFWWLLDKGLFILSNPDLGAGKSKAQVDPVDYIESRRSRATEEKKAIALAARRILTPSLFSENVYLKLGFNNVSRNVNGVLKPSGVKLSNPRSERVLVFGYIDGNTPIKGFHLIQEAFRSLRNENVKLLVADNSNNIGGNSFSDEDFCGISNFEVVPGFTHDRIDDFFGQIDVLLHPSQAAESFGLSIREAVVRDVWVIASDAGGSAEGFVDGMDGLLIPFNNDHTELTAAVVKTIDLFQNGEIRRGDQKRVRGWEDQAKELSQVYREVIN